MSLPLLYGNSQCPRVIRIHFYPHTPLPSHARRDWICRQQTESLMEIFICKLTVLRTVFVFRLTRKFTNRVIIVACALMEAKFNLPCNHDAQRKWLEIEWFWTFNECDLMIRPRFPEKKPVKRQLIHDPRAITKITFKLHASSSDKKLIFGSSSMFLSLLFAVLIAIVCSEYGGSWWRNSKMQLRLHDTRSLLWLSCN